MNGSSGNNDGAHCHLHCTAKLDDVFPTSGDEDEDEKAPRHKRCNYKKSQNLRKAAETI